MRRLLDIVLAIAGLVVAAVPLAVAAAVIRLSLGRPILYRQIRIGRAGRPFCLYKLRTMAAAGNGPQVTATGDSRIGRGAAWLRRWKIDELPQLWNVVTGDLNLVGPRPEVARFVDRYTECEREILQATPGLASLAQLVYPQEAQLLAAHADPEEAYVRYVMPRKIAVDLAYERKRTLWSDLRVIAEVALLILGKSFRVDRDLRLPDVETAAAPPTLRSHAGTTSPSPRSSILPS